MGAMYKVKAYFGMVPAEEMEIDEERYAVARRSSRDTGWDDRWDDDRPDDRWDRRSSDRDDRWEASEPREDRYAGRPDGDRWEAERREAGRWDGDRRDSDRWDAERSAEDRPSERRPARTLPPPVRSVSGPTPVRGALAIDPQAESSLVPPVPSSVPEQRERPATAAAALARITTLQPRSYNEARTIGERYREGVPVIMNLTELDDAAAKRLVDFAAGLVFALRGGFDKVTNRVFLLTPADVEVSADDARKLVGRVGVDRARPTGL